jgi:hypothetical protein
MATRPRRAGAEWVDVRLLRRTRAPLATRTHSPPGFSSLPILGRRLPASSSFVLARALTDATAAGAPA